MTVVLYHRNVTSDASGPGSGALWNHSLLEDVAGNASQMITLGPGEQKTGFVWAEEAVPPYASPAGQTIDGTYSAKLWVTTGNTGIRINSRLIHLRDGNNIGVGNATEIDVTASAGVKTFNYPNKSFDVWEEGDRIGVQWFFKAVFFGGSVTIGANTVNTEFVAPWELAEGEGTALFDGGGEITATGEVSALPEAVGVDWAVYAVGMKRIDKRVRN